MKESTAKMMKLVSHINEDLFPHFHSDIFQGSIRIIEDDTAIVISHTSGYVFVFYVKLQKDGFRYLLSPSDYEKRESIEDIMNFLKGKEHMETIDYYNILNGKSWR